jgi:SAM-dependent methyltransferase
MGDDDLSRLRRDWETLGDEDPLWAVYVTPEAKGGRWDVQEFLETGRRELADSWARHRDAVGREPDPNGVALDFGAGAGRLSAALATRMRSVVGVELSASMVRTGRRVIPPELLARVAFVQSASPSLPLRTGSVDLVYTSLVLQHMPAPLAEAYVVDFLRVLSPGGTAMVQVAESPRWSAKGLAFRWLPPRAYGWAQQRLLGYPAPMRMEQTTLARLTTLVERVGGEVVAHWEDTSYGGHWTYRRGLIRRSVAAPLRAAGGHRMSRSASRPEPRS